MRSLCRAAPTLLLLLFLGLVAAPVAIGATRSAAVPRASGSDPAAALQYWTPERLQQATPLPPVTVAPFTARRGASESAARGRPFLVGAAAAHTHRRFRAGQGRVGGATASLLLPEGTDTGDPTVFPNRVNGNIFFKSGGNDYSCSGSVVNTPAKHTVWTAGHCIVDPDTAAPSTEMVFIPGYRDGAAPFGIWPATKLEAPQGYVSSAAAGNSNEALDFGTFQVSANSSGQQLEGVLGGFGIGFNQTREQTYTEYGYPGEFPYDGNRLYSITSPHTGDDTTYFPATLQIASDFTAGASGGPYVVGTGPTILSDDVYGYVGDPEHSYGPYFGDAAKNFYATVAGIFEVTGIKRNKRKGTATLRIQVPDAGSLSLFGPAVRSEQTSATGAGTVSLAVIPKGASKRRLRRQGRLNPKVQISYSPQNGTPNTETKPIRLVRR